MKNWELELEEILELIEMAEAVLESELTAEESAEIEKEVARWSA